MNAVVKIGETEFQPARFTRDVIVELADSGLLGRMGRVEVIDGVLVEMPPSWLPHGRAIMSVGRALLNEIEDRAVVSSDQLVLFGDKGMHAPDIAVFDAGFSKRKPDSGDLRMAIEIADTSLDYDLGAKADRYAAFGVPELWVVDLDNRRLIVHREPGDDGYGSVQSHDWTEPVASLIAPDDPLTLSEVLK